MGYGGRKLKKYIWVHTNDPATPKQKLEIAGEVERFAQIQPKGLVKLTGNIGKPIKKTITITPEEKYPFKIKEIKALKGKDIKVEMRETETDQHRYLITVENTKTEQGRYFDTLTLTTTSDIRPEITIRIFGDIRDPKLSVTKKSDS